MIVVVLILQEREARIGLGKCDSERRRIIGFGSRCIASFLQRKEEKKGLV